MTLFEKYLRIEIYPHRVDSTRYNASEAISALQKHSKGKQV